MATERPETAVACVWKCCASWWTRWAAAWAAAPALRASELMVSKNADVTLGEPAAALRWKVRSAAFNCARMRLVKSPSTVTE